MVAMKQMLGSGIYTVHEAALYARVSARMMSRWMFGTKSRQSVITPQFDTQERLVSFFDLVQTLAIREIRIQNPNIALQKFRQAIAVAEENGMTYPFARQHCTYLWDETLVIKLPDETLIEASGKHRRQPLFPFVESYLQNLTFDSSGLASLYSIYCYRGVVIKMQPGVRFGEPILPSGYSAMTIWESIKVEGGIERAAKAYGIPAKEVDAAYHFFVDHLGTAAA